MKGRCLALVWSNIKNFTIFFWKCDCLSSFFSLWNLLCIKRISKNIVMTFMLCKTFLGGLYRNWAHVLIDLIIRSLLLYKASSLELYPTLNDLCHPQHLIDFSCPSSNLSLWTRIYPKHHTLNVYPLTLRLLLRSSGYCWTLGWTSVFHACSGRVFFVCCSNWPFNFLLFSLLFPTYYSFGGLGFRALAGWS